MQKPPVNAQKAKCHEQTNQSTDRRTRNSRVHMTKKKCLNILSYNNYQCSIFTWSKANDHFKYMGYRGRAYQASGQEQR